jgi:2-C-methyl-D-erythritol 4-phosphate cytidylyltransferase
MPQSPTALRGDKGSVGIVVVAAGQGQRMEGRDKIFSDLGGLPLVLHCLRVFTSQSYVTRVVLVLPGHRLEDGQTVLQNLRRPQIVALCQGGPLRQDSVRLGLEALPPCDWVVVHDGARPLIDGQLLDRGLEAARETGAAIAAVPANDTIKVVSEQGLVRHTPQRDGLWTVQTPQVFRYHLLKEAHETCQGTFTDDAAMAESLGHPVKVFMGSYRNIKVTTPEDLLMAQALFSSTPVGATPP